MIGCQQLCVYTHSANGCVFYVGQGSRARAYERHGRGPRWKKYVENIGVFDVAIHIKTDDRVEAQRIEAELITTHHPPCNVHKHDDKIYKPRKIVGRDCCIRIRPSLKAALEAAAEKEERSVSQLVAMRLEAAMKAEGFLK